MESKKWLLPVLMALLVLTASTVHAQVRFGIKGGANIAKVHFSKDVLYSDNITGFHIGPMIEFMPKSGMGLDFAILYSQKGYIQSNLQYDANKTINHKSNYLEVPLNLKMKIGIPVISPYFSAGPYVSFLVGGEKEYTPIRDYLSSYAILGQIKNKSFGAGLNFTAGVEVLSHLQVGLTYNWGLTDYYDTFNASDLSQYRGKPRTWLISAAVLF